MITDLLKLICEELLLILTATTDLASLVSDVKKKTGELGRRIVQTIIEILDQSLVELENQKNSGQSKEQDIESYYISNRSQKYTKYPIFRISKVELIPEPENKQDENSIITGVHLVGS